MEDLSLKQGPLSKLFNYSKDPADIERFKLTEEEIERFNRDGFITGIPCLNDEQVEQLKTELQLIMTDENAKKLFHEYHTNESPDPSVVLFHALGAWRVGTAFHDLLWHSPILVKAAQLLGGSVRFWHDQLFVKPPRNGSVVAWHQDYSYWTRTQPQAHLTVHIALDEQTIENGCLHYIPGSHKWPLLPITSRHFNDMDSIQSVLTEEQRSQFRPTPMLLKKGEICLHHGHTVHGSFGNKSDGYRRATVLNFFRDGVVSNTDEPLLNGVDVVPKGHRMQGRFFPLLWDIPV